MNNLKELDSASKIKNEKISELKLIKGLVRCLFKMNKKEKRKKEFNKTQHEGFF